MRWWRWQGGMLKQIRFWFLILLTLNQIALLACLYVLLVRPAAESFSAVSLGLVDATLKQQSQNVRSLGLIQDHWGSPGHIVVTTVPPLHLKKVPPFPGLRAVERLVHASWGDKIIVSFTSTPERMVWFHYRDEESFFVGIPMDQRMLGLVFLVVAVVLIFVLSTAASWAVAVRLTQPLNELSNTALRLGQGEDVGEIRVVPSAPDEVTRLAGALNQMRDEIHQMLQERERFLAEVAHDMRTPLSRMRVALELHAPEYSEFYEGLKEDIEEMRTILDQFLELSRLDMEESETVVLGNLNEIVQSIAAKYERAGEPMLLELPALRPFRYRPVALQRLLYNLMDNALRHGRGPVLVETGWNELGAWISVTNEIQEQVRDSALMSALTWASDGQQSGLGLAIVRRITKVHDASMQVFLGLNDTRKVTIQFRQDT